nr:MAG TPA: TMEM61 protein family [Caudoviricetes sp.]
MSLRYRIPLPGPFYYSGRVGPKHWLPRDCHSSPGPMGFVVKWFIIYPSIVFFGAGLAILLAPFYGLFWVVRRSLRRRQRCQPVAQCFPVHRPLPQRSVSGFVSRPYGFVPAQRERVAVGGGPFGSDRCV